jgi:hypothetical protein
VTMRQLWPWRRSLIVWFTPVLIVVSLAMSSANSAYLNDYWLDITAKSTVGMALVCAGYAALAAWEAGRWHAQYAQTPASRPALLLMALTLLPAAVGALVIYLVNLVVLATSALPTAGMPNGWLLALVWGLTVTYAALGYVLGVVLPRLFAVPLALVAVWLWLVFPPAFQPFWVRNITGNLGTSCCGFENVLPWRALAGPSIVGAAIALAAVLVICATRTRWAAALVVAVSLIGLSVLPARAIVLRYGADPIAPRTGGLTCDTSTRFRVCAWVEHSERAAAAIPVLTDAATRMEKAGLHPPGTLTEDVTPTSTAWTFSLTGDNENDWRRSLAIAPMTGIPPACLEQTGGVWAAVDAYGVMTAWLMLTAGISPGDLERRVEPTDLSTAVKIRAAPIAEQRTWALGALRALATCTQPAPAPPLT